MAIAHAQPSANSGADSRGEQLFELHCAPCHVDQPQGLLKKPPNLSGVFSKPSLSSGAPATAAQVRKEIIEDIGTMPAFDGRLSDRDVQDLITYLRLLH
jgi:mono/diheme cytochrome c family protein